MCAGLFVLVLGLLRGNTAGWSSTGIVAGLTAAAVLLASFVVIQQRKEQPMMPLGLFANRSFAGAQVAAFAISASFFAMFFYATIYVQAMLVWDAVETPAVLLEGIARSCTPAGLAIEGSA